ncbi:hypothetical protein GCM10023191_081250 [Actinoallomurus oryzae]|uniref:Uncharacterized protein n=1 Tax=Actinoallomurus oryzae TaxID=502180 RepID=A0ABP8QZ12_9ACTN
MATAFGEAGLAVGEAEDAPDAASDDLQPVSAMPAISAVVIGTNVRRRRSAPARSAANKPATSSLHAPSDGVYFQQRNDRRLCPCWADISRKDDLWAARRLTEHHRTASEPNLRRR